MAIFPDAPDYEYVAYIDEAGDPGIKRVRPIDETGGTEWMTLSAVLVRKENVRHVPRWVADIIREIGTTQRGDLHFRKLSPTRRLSVCRQVAELPVRLFVVATNKKNMRGYRNKRAERVSSDQWFYNWIVRILIERVTNYVEYHSLKRFGEPRMVTFEFSQRGGHSYSQTAAYHELLRVQSRTDNTVLKKWVPKREVMHWKLVDAYPHKTRAGLQLSDVVASSFYVAADCLDTGPCDPRYAMALEPRIAFRGNKRYSDYGVVLQPTPPQDANLTLAQREVFEFYGYGFD